MDVVYVYVRFERGGGTLGGLGDRDREKVKGKKVSVRNSGLIVFVCEDRFVNKLYLFSMKAAWVVANLNRARHSARKPRACTRHSRVDAS